MGFKYPFYLQHIKHIALILGADFLDPQSSLLMYSVWEEACYECGCGPHLADIPEEALELMTEGWLKETLLFMKKHNIGISQGGSKEYFPRCNDSYIMSHLIEVCKNKTTLQALNQCRLYLNIEKVSDLTSAKGSKVLSSEFNKVLLERHIAKPRTRRTPLYDQHDWKT